MSTPFMKIDLGKISEHPTELHFNQEEPWLRQAVSQVDEHYEEISILDSTKHALSALLLDAVTHREIHARLSFRKVDAVYLVSGQIKTFVVLICSRCTTEFKHFCQPNFSALFCKDPVLAGIAHLEKSDTHPHSSKVVGHNYGQAHHHYEKDQNPTELTQAPVFLESQDLDITYLSQEYIDLQELLTEQIQLQVPFQPLCQMHCQGICSHCGIDLNHQVCQCAQETQNPLFSSLKTYSIGE